MATSNRNRICGSRRERSETYSRSNNPVSNPKQEIDRDHCHDRRTDYWIFPWKTQTLNTFSFDFYLNFGIPNVRHFLHRTAMWRWKSGGKKMCGFWSKPRTMQCFLIGLNYWARVIWKTEFGVRARQGRWSADMKRKQCEAREELSIKIKKNENETFMKCECSGRKKYIMIKMGMKKPHTGKERTHSRFGHGEHTSNGFALCWAVLCCVVLMCAHLKYSIMYFRIMSERNQCMWTNENSLAVAFAKVRTAYA